VPLKEMNKRLPDMTPKGMLVGVSVSRNKRKVKTNIYFEIYCCNIDNNITMVTDLNIWYHQ
jgi:hypothetical protein